MAYRELVSIRKMSRQIFVLPVVYEDNQAAIRMAKSDDPQSPKHTVKLCYHYVRLEVAKKNVVLR